MRRVRASTPASTANLGAGFDCLGLALGLRNSVEAWDEGSGSGVVVAVEGEGAERLPRDGRNLIARAAERLFQQAGRRPAGRLCLRAANRIPLGSGLGSSAASIVGGLVAANALVGAGLPPEALLRLAAEVEGHPDNVAAALYGGLIIVSARADALLTQVVAVPPLTVVVVLPEVRLSTAQARAALPAQVPLGDAVFNIGAALLTVQALAAGDLDRLGRAMADRLHQPFRQRLVPGYAEVEAAARAAGAAAVALSGAGPSLVAFAAERHAEIAAAMQAAFERQGLASRSFILPVDAEGVKMEEDEGRGKTADGGQ